MAEVDSDHSDPSTSKQKLNIKRFFTVFNNISSRCRLCSNIIKHHNNTTNMKNHILRKHPQALTETEKSQKRLKLSKCLKNVDVNNGNDNEDFGKVSSGSHGETDKSDNADSINSFDSIASTVTLADSCLSGSVSTSSSSSSISQKTINQAFQSVKSFSEGGKMNAKITNAIVYMTVVDNLPLSTTENRGFKFLMKTLVPLYKVPGRSTITRYVDEKFSVLSAGVKEEFLTVNYFTITSDAWTDCLNTRGFLGLTVHYLHLGTLTSVTLGVYNLEKNHTHDYIGSIMLSTLKDWNIPKEKIVAAVTDNGANMVKAVHEFFGPKKHLPCFAHNINLIVKNAMKPLGILRAIIEKVKTIVTFFKQSLSASDKLRALQLNNGKTEGTLLKLVQECETRWNTVYYMLKRFIELAEYVSTVLFNFPKVPMLSHEELESVKEVIQILEPFEKVTVEMSAQQYVTCSKVIPIVHCLHLTLPKINVKSNIGNMLLENLSEELKRRFYSEESNMEKNQILGTSTLLDPRFKRIHFESPVALANIINKISNYINSEIKTNRELGKNNIVNNTIQNTSETTDVWSVHDSLIQPTNEVLPSTSTSGGMPTELKLYLDQPILSRFEDPIKYWDNVKQMFPNLYKIAMQYLPVVATSVPSERIFSKAGNILTEKRNRLCGKRLSSLIFLSSLDDSHWQLQ